MTKAAVDLTEVRLQKDFFDNPALYRLPTEAKTALYRRIRKEIGGGSGGRIFGHKNFRYEVPFYVSNGTALSCVTVKITVTDGHIHSIESNSVPVPYFVGIGTIISKED